MKKLKPKNFVLFIGYERSGHTLVGSLLDAHKNIIISNEFSITKYFRQNSHIKKDYIFQRLLDRSFYQKFEQDGGRAEIHTGKDGKLTYKYQYNVPNQWQGKYEELKVLGDKHGPNCVLSYEADEDIFTKFYNVIQTPIKFIHVIRNPYDNIARMNPKRASGYFHWVDLVNQIKTKYPYRVLDIYSEDIIKNCKTELKRVCEFLEVEYDEKWAKDCASIVFDKPHKMKDQVRWNSEQLKYIKNQIAKYPFLERYKNEKV